MRRVATLLCLCASAQAFDLRPDGVNVELAHTSHMSQHFGADPTNYGFDTALLTATWRPLPRLAITVGEGVVLEGCERSITDRWCGALFGPRETFNARVAYTIWSK